MKSEITMLMQFGFSNLEAETYIELLEEPGITGYKIAQKLGKSAPNIYKVLDILIQKGIVVDDKSSSTRRFMALAIDEYLDQVEVDFKSRRKELEDIMRQYDNVKQEEGIFPLISVEQVYNKTFKLIDNAEKVILVNAFPGPLSRIKIALTKAASKGVRVIVKTYSEMSIKGCEVIVDSYQKSYVENWNGEWLNIIADGKEHILSMFNKRNNTLHKALWNISPYFLLTIYNEFFCEFAITVIEKERGINKSKGECLPELERFDSIRPHKMPAFNSFMEKFFD